MNKCCQSIPQKPAKRSLLLSLWLLALLFVPALLFPDPWTLPRGAWKGSGESPLILFVNPMGNIITNSSSPDANLRYSVHVLAQVRNEYWVHLTGPALIPLKKPSPDAKKKDGGKGEEREAAAAEEQKSDAGDATGLPEFVQADRILFYYETDSLTLSFFKGNSIVKSMVLKGGG